MATVKDCHELTSYYIKLFKLKYGVAPNVNRIKARWSWDSMFQSMNKAAIKSLIDYYFMTASACTHNLEWFFYNYDKLLESAQAVREDRVRMEKLLKETEQRTEQWRNK